ncbi:hypothetical protein SAMN05421773_12258 [Streptomyces aidingensis]|uniref:Uncharacterized protein n=1 Tax=Streptomyces aidingensis TaxID=910347 RepID=A0A1I1U2U0_9ACTN|nr:hypothetical protein SAMN05421773_12258 [Streptomyces aidingensis]
MGSHVTSILGAHPLPEHHRQVLLECHSTTSPHAPSHRHLPASHTKQKTTPPARIPWGRRSPLLLRMLYDRARLTAA